AVGARGEHTDPGLLPLWTPAAPGGVQAFSPDEGWFAVDPRPGTVVVNLADCMQVWTNDRYRAAMHRVLPMDTTDRMSIPYFFNPAVDAVVAPADELVGSDPIYRSFVFREFINARGADNYADAGVDDTQISDYRIFTT
ncbi:MAG: 2OG-Fe(II) oxygenase family protein, partial [Acidimicrobiia bacterium]|nr:2OG-Fe(II) oxygenase family protein [Acidimicrobiia bacterium]